MACTRRDVLRGIGAATVASTVTIGCGDDGDSTPALPDDLPEYEFTGTPGPENLFEHGVASGDPLPDAVILWTRVSTEDETPVEVWWEMALDQEFTQRVAQGTVTTDGSRDFTAKIDATGLIWGRNYYYRFFALGRQSSVGRTRLASEGTEADRLRMAVCSCSNFGFGFFHSYRHIAERADLDLVLHLGDYFYEYGVDTYPTQDEALRTVDPVTETISLADYRTRFAQYRRDADLQDAHRQHPWVVVWDDHETANNSWIGGAENHQPETEGPWAERLAQARQAFFESIPIRDTPNGELFRSFGYGDLMDLVMLDTRIAGREEQFPSLFVTPSDIPSLPDDILGPEQEQWLFDRLRESNAQWKVIGQQVVLAFWRQDENLVNADQWQGYPGSRERLMNFLRDNDISNVVVVTGDVHSSWAMDVTADDDSYDPATGDGAVAVEFVAPGITSPSGFPPGFAGILQESSPHIRFFETESNGYFVLDVQGDKAQADWYLLDGIAEEDGEESFAGAYAVLDGTRRVVEMDAPESDAPDPFPLATG